MANGTRSPGMPLTYLETSGPFVRIWVHCDGRAASRVDRLLDEAAAWLQASAPPPPRLLVYGQLLAVRSHGLWHRARLAAPPSRSSRSLFVLLIDIGCSEFVAPANVRLPAPDSPELWYEPAHASAYMLARIVHPGGRWEEPVVSFLRRFVFSHEVRLRKELVHGETVFVSLTVDGDDLVHRLTSNSIGVRVTIEWQAMLYDKYKRDVVSLPPVQSSPSPDTYLSMPLAFKPRRLDINSVHLVKITHARDGPEAFAVCLQNDEHTLAFIKQEIEAVGYFKYLQALPTIGTVCLAKFSNNMLHRAVVVEPINNRAKLYSVDYGSTEWVSFGDIFEIPRELVIPKVLAFKFCLAGMTGEVVNDWTRRVFSMFGNTLKMRVVLPDGPPLVQYCELALLDGRDVKELLMSDNFSWIEEFHRVYVSSVESCSRFYIRLLKYNTEFKKITKLVQNHCYRTAPMLYPKIKPGVLCCALYPDDEKWYRALILTIRKDRVMVKYIDYGNNTEVSINQVKPINNDLMKLHPQAIQCALQGYEDSPYNEEAADRLETLTIDTELRLNICGVLGQNTFLVKLFNDKMNPADISEHLTAMMRQKKKAHHLSSNDLTRQDGCSGFNKYNNLVKIRKMPEPDVSHQKERSQPATTLEIRDNLAVAVSLGENKGDVMDLELLIGQKFYAKILLVMCMSKFYLCLEPLKSDNNEIITEVSVNKSNGLVECSIYNLENITSTITDNDFKIRYENKYVIAYVHAVTNRFKVTLYDASTGKKLECFIDDTVADDSDVICPHPVFNKHFGPSYVSHVESINAIFIQRIKNIDSLSLLLDEMYNFYEHKEDAETLVSPQINNICVVKSTDDNWYRAKITKVLSDECEVLYVDYGNREAIPINNLKILDEQFYVQPEYAIQCGLKNAKSDSNITDNKLKNLLLDKEVCVVLNKSDVMPVKWISTITVGKVNIDDDLFGIVTASESEPNVQNDAQLDNNLELLTVFVSHIDSPGQFWLKFSADSQNFENLNVKLNNAESFDDLLKYEIGTQCVAKYSACERYYRVVILNCDNEKILVRFIDFGNSENLDNKPGVLKCIPKDWPAIKPLSVRCSVNASPAGMGEWTEQATELFTESVGDIEKPIRAKFIFKENKTYVDLYNNDVNITDVLVNAGHATPTEKLESNNADDLKISPPGDVVESQYLSTNIDVEDSSALEISPVKSVADLNSTDVESVKE